MAVNFLPLVAVLIATAVAIRLVAGALDGERIANHFEQRGWTVLSQAWDPFGPGWFGERNARIYRVAYVDEQGARRTAHVKTSMLSGVYLTGHPTERRSGRGARSADAGCARRRSDRTGDLAAENAALRAQLARLQNRRGVDPSPREG